nr:hypothetical protein [Kiritimatiellia bacterium]
MPKFNHEDLEAVLNVIYRKGIITAVDGENDTADVDVPGGQSGSGVPIYYHCEPDSELRSNGAIEGGSAAFGVDDEVIVMCDTEGVPLRIIGFVDGIRVCGFHEPFDGSVCHDNFAIYALSYQSFDSMSFLFLQEAPEETIANMPQTGTDRFFCDNLLQSANQDIGAVGNQNLSYVECLGPGGDADLALQYEASYDGGAAAYRLIRYWEGSTYQWVANREVYTFGIQWPFYKRSSEDSVTLFVGTEYEEVVSGWKDEKIIYSFDTVYIYVTLVEHSARDTFYQGGGYITFRYIRPNGSIGIFYAAIWSATIRPA